MSFLGDEFEEQKPKRGVGRPTLYNVEFAEEICQKIGTTNWSLKRVCEFFNINPDTIYFWINKFPEFSDRYSRAKQEQADFLVDEMLEIADEEVPRGDMAAAAMKKLAVETRKFIASKLKPKVYGNNSDLNVNVTKSISLDGNTMQNLISMAIEKKQEEERNKHIEEAQRVDDDFEEIEEVDE